MTRALVLALLLPMVLPLLLLGGTGSLTVTGPDLAYGLGSGAAGTTAFGWAGGSDLAQVSAAPDRAAGAVPERRPATRAAPGAARGDRQDRK